MVAAQRSPFDPELDAMRSMGREVVDRVAEFVDGRYAARTSDFALLPEMLSALAGLPPQSQGVLTPGGSMSTLSAVVAARSDRLGESFVDGTLYVSAEVHHSVAKAA